MDEVTLSSYLQAGKIASDILRRSASEIREGDSYLSIVEFAEGLVLESEAELAFPLNLSINEAAAHDTAGSADQRIFLHGDVVKVDLGVHIDGCIADCATTVDLGSNSLLLEASRVALEGAIRVVRPGITAGEIGSVIQKEIESRGYRPIVNLTGHGLGRFIVHQPPNIPNIATRGGAVLEEGMVFAIEPFATTGTGFVSERKRLEIYSQISTKSVRLPSARQLISELQSRRGLPFARRWLKTRKLEIVLPALVNSGILHQYPVLADVPGSLVSQHEHTLIVTEDGALVTTR